jgi:hypothetical protein
MRMRLPAQGVLHNPVLKMQLQIKIVNTQDST